MRMLTLIRAGLAAAMMAASATAVTAQTLVLEYYHLDAPGSVRAVTDKDRNLIRRHDFFPFGEEVPPQALTADAHRFTGKPRDAETGLDYFGARLYATQRARFLTIDPVLDIPVAILEPGAWNRYSYSRNSPLRFVDPDGRNPLLIAALISAGGSAAVKVFSNLTSDKPWHEGVGGAAAQGFGEGLIPIGGVLKVVRGAGIIDDAARGSFTVYQSISKVGQVQYVGMTSDLGRRAAQHLTQRGFEIGKLMGNLSKSDARAVEQALIEIHGLGKNQGTLLNKINSIAQKNPEYAAALRRGYDLLKTIGYK